MSTAMELPGFVDTQLNGAFGYDFTNDPGSIWRVGGLLPRTGVTAFVPTIISSPPQAALAALRVLRSGPPEGWIGATPLGIHLEGPMISPQRRGTHPEEFVTAPSAEIVDRLISAGPPLMVTIAPELPGAEEAIRRFADVGTVVSMGHSNASSSEASSAVEWGARHATHLFNAMSGLDHRHPGMAATVLTDQRVTTGLIADGVHVAAEMLDLAFKAKGPERIALVTDAMAAMGTEQQDHHIGSVPVTRDGRVVRNSEGQLAGSAAAMDHMVRTMIDATGCTLPEAAEMASSTPAKIVGLTPDPGDVVTLDGDLAVVCTRVSGHLVYERASA